MRGRSCRSITGSENVLTANTAGIADPNGLGTFSFQWQASADGLTGWVNVGNPTANPNFTVAAGDYEAWRLRVAERVEIFHEHEWSDGHRSFYFRDPAGNLLEIANADLWPR